MTSAVAPIHPRSDGDPERDPDADPSYVVGSSVQSSSDANSDCDAGAYENWSSWAVLVRQCQLLSLKSEATSAATDFQ